MSQWYGLILVGACLVTGCTHAEPLPPVPPPPDDLSTWSVPALMQPPAPVAQRPAPVEDKPTPAERVYAYAPGTAYAAPVALGRPLDIVLERGEQVRNIVGGDRAPVESGQSARLEIKEGAEGIGDTLRPHVFVTAAEAGLNSGLLITTTKRTYLLTVQSLPTSPIRVVRWRYPVELPGATPLAEEPPAILPHPARPARFHSGYALASQGTQPDWLPRQIVDDGKKLYIIYPEIVRFGTVPLVRKVGANGPQLLNARQYLNVVIIDELAARLELRGGTGEQAEVVTITRGELRTITCPGESACPAWPPTDATLDGR